MISKSKSKSKLKVQILAGGISHERDVSLKSGRRVADALLESGVEVIIREPDEKLLANIKKDKPDVIWPLLHGASGEDGALRDVLSLTKVPFVGATASGARLAWDKSVAKILVAKAGIQTAISVTLPKEAFRELDADGVLKAVTQSISFPLVVKPARSGSAQGVSVVTKASELSRAMVDAYVYCDVVVIEKFIDGTELAISVIDLGSGAIALPAVEIEAVSGRFGYQARYTAGETNYFVPARISRAVSDRAAKLAITVHETLGLRHLSRIDVIVDKMGVVWFLEANVCPGMTETSLLPQAVVAEGSTLSSVYRAIAESALRTR
jgi:D-alanine-D-alanine ligase